MTGGRMPAPRIIVCLLLLAAVLTFDLSTFPAFKAIDGSCPHSLSKWSMLLKDWRKLGRHTEGTIIGNGRYKRCQAYRSHGFASTRRPTPLDASSQFCRVNYAQFEQCSNRLYAAGALLHVGAACILFLSTFVPSSFSVITSQSWRFRIQVLGSWIMTGSLMAAIGLLFDLNRRLPRFEMRIARQFDSQLVCDNREYRLDNQGHLYMAVAVLLVPATIFAGIWTVMLTCMLDISKTRSHTRAAVHPDGLRTSLLSDSTSIASGASDASSIDMELADREVYGRDGLT